MSPQPVHHMQTGYIVFTGGRMEDFADEYRNELFDELMTQWEIQQERQAELNRMAEERELEELLEEDLPF